jgi:uncharacterized protein
MAPRIDELDLASLRLAAGEGRRMELQVAIEPFEFAGEMYAAEPTEVPARLTISRMVGVGYALHLEFSAAIVGPCMRCLKPAAPYVEVDAREVDRPGEGEELDSPYVREEKLDISGWARDSLVLAMPAKILCREDCAGLCPICAIDLNEAGPGHAHETAPDPRWSKLSELKFE